LVIKRARDMRQWAYEQQAYFGLLPKHAPHHAHTAEKLPQNGRLGQTGQNLNEGTAWLRGVCPHIHTVEELWVEQSQLQEEMVQKERIKSALRRWHPDRFGRVLGRVDEKDKEAVERGVGIVARCLNDLLAQEN